MKKTKREGEMKEGVKKFTGKGRKCTIMRRKIFCYKLYVLLDFSWNWTWKRSRNYMLALHYHEEKYIIIRSTQMLACCQSS